MHMYIYIYKNVYIYIYIIYIERERETNKIMDVPIVWIELKIGGSKAILIHFSSRPRKRYLSFYQFLLQRMRLGLVKFQL